MYSGYLKLVKRNLVALLALGACFFALSVIELGAFTRLMDAGLGCPDWPGCYGSWVVPHGETIVAYKAWAEMIHRYFAGSLAVIIMSICILLLVKNIRSRTNAILAVMLLLLISGQIMLGELTVTLKLFPAVVTQHLLGGFFILAVLWLVYLHNQKKVPQQNFVLEARSLLPWGMGALLIVIAQITLGAWTSTNYASLSCPDFPFCSHASTMLGMDYPKDFAIFSPLDINYDGGILPMYLRQTIHMTHRFGALILSVYLFIVFLLSIVKLRRSPDMMKLLYIIIGLLCIQLCIGILNVLLKVSLVSALFHNFTAALLFLAVLTWVFKLIMLSRKAALT